MSSVVTNSVGQFSIENLRPGTYAVTFTLPGFSTVKREGIELTGSFVATVNADLKVGGVAETVKADWTEAGSVGGALVAAAQR